jgi:SAM-dependent methyltransferase
MFRELAPYYDRFVAEKNYAGECRRLEELVRKYGSSGGRSWLDVACGTGRHLEFLRRNHTVVGADMSPEMLRVARRRLPGVELHRSDLREWQFHRAFDVVTCLFGAIGHLGEKWEIRAVFERIADHLEPGGVAIVEPWIDPDRFRPGFVHLMHYDDPDTKLVRLSYSTRHGSHSVIHSHYLVGERGKGIRHLEETDRTGLLVPRARYLEWMREAGLRARFLTRGLRPGSGLLIGVKPLLPPEKTVRAA